MTGSCPHLRSAPADAADDVAVDGRALPPKPRPRPDKVGPLRYLRLFRQDILSAQPARLYHAWMAEFRTPFFRSFLINQPELIRLVLNERPRDFPKSDRIREGLAPLLGQSVFVTNGAQWERQRRIINPAFEGGRLRQTFGPMVAAVEAAVARLALMSDGRPIEIEEFASRAAADVIFRTLFSVPIEDEVAGRVFAEFRAYQRAQPLLNAAAFLPLPRWLPRWLPRGHGRKTRAAAASIRGLITQMVSQRLAQIEAGTAPDDLATKIMTTPDPETGRCFEVEDMVDQVAIFFLAGHETSAASVAWALYLLAVTPEAQARAAEEAACLTAVPALTDLSRLTFIRDCYRESLRLYPPVPMMVREATGLETFRGRRVARGAQVVLSPWHLHRHTRLWRDADHFQPERWATSQGKNSARSAYLPFSAGERVCPGASFAMAEGVLFIAMVLRRFALDVPPEQIAPVPVAHLTVRARDGIWLTCSKRTAQEP